MATRAERKAKRREHFERIQREKEERIKRQREFESRHPVLSGAVRVTNYVEPKWAYTRA